MTIWESYCKANDDLDSNYISLDSYVGRKVRYRYYKDGVEHWSDSIHTVESYDDNLCGDGCCNGFYISGVSNNSFWSSQLLIVE